MKVRVIKMKKTITTKKILNALYGTENTTNIMEITRATLNGVIHLLISESKAGNVTYTYQVYNANNKSQPLIVSLDLYNRLLELFTTKTFKKFKVENYLIINGAKWENIENINICSVDETMRIIDDALSHGFSFLVHNHKLYYKED